MHLVHRDQQAQEEAELEKQLPEMSKADIHQHRVEWLGVQLAHLAQQCRIRIRQELQASGQRIDV